MKRTLWTLAIAVALWGCGKTPEAAPPHGEGGHAHDHDDEHGGEHEEEHAGHDHGHPELPLDQLDAARCEHDIPQVACAECRYELGVVEVPPELAHGLLTAGAAVAPGRSEQVLRLRCESGMDEARRLQVVARLGGRVLRVNKPLGSEVMRGDVIAMLASDDFTALKVRHQASHQEADLAALRHQRLVTTRTNLATLLDQLGQTESGGLDMARLDQLEMGRVKGEVLAAANALERARTDWQRVSRLVADGRRLVDTLTGKDDADLGRLAVGEWKGRLLATRAEVRLARKSYDRVRDLAAKGVASSREAERARRDLDVARAGFQGALEQTDLDLAAREVGAREDLNTARARLQAAVEQVLFDLEEDELAARQRLEAARSRWAVNHRELSLLGFRDDEFEQLSVRDNDETGRLELRATAAGTIIQQHLSPGQVVEPGDPLFRIVDLSRLWVWCHVYEKDLAPLLESTLPRLAEVSSEAFPGRIFTGQLDYLDRVTDARSRTVLARVTTDNRSGLLRPNMFLEARVNLPSGGTGEVAVPRLAVVRDEGVAFVFVHWRDHYWVKRTVTVARQDESRAYLSAGLAPGDDVAVDGTFFLKSDVLREKMGAGCAD